MAYTTPDGGGLVDTIVYPVLTENRLDLDQPYLWVRQLDPAGCETDNAQASPSGRWLVLEYNCEDTFFIRLFDSTSQQPPLTWERGFFLDWSPDSKWFLFQHSDQEQIQLISVDGHEQHPLNLPFGTYNAVFAPDGQTVVYVASQGLGFGSEIGSLALSNGARTIWREYPNKIVGLPRWSPNGQYLAYVLMPDGNIPYTVGELWLADENGHPIRKVDEIDAGHGYPPVWSPDSQWVAYVRRENPDLLLADHLPQALSSNIYQVDLKTGLISQRTYFQASQVYDIAWSPDGGQLAVTVDNGVWIAPAGEQAYQVSPAGVIARHPVWLFFTTP